MADPITAMAIVAVAGSVFTGVTAYQNGQAQQDAYNAAAKAEEQKAEQRARAIKSESRRMMGTQRARFAAAGIDLSGSVLDVQQDTVNEARIDAMTVLTQGYQDASALRFKGNVASSNGMNALVSSGFNAGGSVLGGIGQYNQYKATTGHAPTWRS